MKSPSSESSQLANILLFAKRSVQLSPCCFAAADSSSGSIRGGDQIHVFQTQGLFWSPFLHLYLLTLTTHLIFFLTVLRQYFDLKAWCQTWYKVLNIKPRNLWWTLLPTYLLGVKTKWIWGESIKFKESFKNVDISSKSIWHMKLRSLMKTNKSSCTWCWVGLDIKQNQMSWSNVCKRF